MVTRYKEMMVWGIIQLAFIGLVILIYSFFNHRRSIQIKAGNSFLKTIYIQDIMLILFLSIIVGIRCNCGSDYFNYYIAFNGILKWYSSILALITARFQNGLYVIAYIVRFFGGADYVFFGVVALITYCIILSNIRKYSVNVTVSVMAWLLLGYLSMSANIMKQSIAMSILVAGYFARKEKKNILFWILCLFACMCHISCIYVVGIMAVVTRIHTSRNLLYKMVIVGLSATLLLEPIAIVLLNVVPAQYQTYLNAVLAGDNDLKLSLGGAFVSIFYLFFIWLMTDVKFETKIKNTIYWDIMAIIITCIPWLMISIRYYIFNRVAYEGLQFIIFLIPIYLSSINKANRKYIIILMVLYSFVFAVLCAENNYYNYSTVFNDIPMSVTDFVNR